MRSWMLILVILVLMAHFGFAQEGNSATKSNSTPTNQPASPIPVGEAHFTPEQLKDYYMVYKNPDVRYLREVFDACLHGTGGTDEEFALLKKWDSDYYRSKFIVFARNRNTFGGALIKVMFQDRPDKVFTAWVYAEGGEGKLTLRAFEPDKFNEEDIKRIKIRYRQFLDDKEHSM